MFYFKQVSLFLVLIMSIGIYALAIIVTIALGTVHVLHNHRKGRGEVVY